MLNHHAKHAGHNTKEQIKNTSTASRRSPGLKTPPPFNQQLLLLLLLLSTLPLQLLLRQLPVVNRLQTLNIPSQLLDNPLLAHTVGHPRVTRQRAEVKPQSLAEVLGSHKVELKVVKEPMTQGDKRPDPYYLALW
jgi:hypothetical protein